MPSCHLLLKREVPRRRENVTIVNNHHMNPTTNATNAINNTVNTPSKMDNTYELEQLPNNIVANHVQRNWVDKCANQQRIEDMDPEDIDVGQRALFGNYSFPNPDEPASSSNRNDSVTAEEHVGPRNEPPVTPILEAKSKPTSMFPSNINPLPEGIHCWSPLDWVPKKAKASTVRRIKGLSRRCSEMMRRPKVEGKPKTKKTAKSI